MAMFDELRVSVTRTFANSSPSTSEKPKSLTVSRVVPPM